MKNNYKHGKIWTLLTKSLIQKRKDVITELWGYKNYPHIQKERVKVIHEFHNVMPNKEFLHSK